MTTSSLSKQEKLLLNEFPKTFRVSFLNLSNLGSGIFDRSSYLLLVISYLQTFFINMQIIRKYVPADESKISDIFRVLEDYINFDNTFSYDKYDGALVVFGCLIILYLVCIISNFLVVAFVALRPNKYNYSATITWSFLIKAHALLFFSPINNLTTRIIFEFNNDNLKIFENDGINQAIMFSSIIGLIINGLFAALPYIILFNLLPNKSLLASKWSFSEQAILYQKLMICLIGRFFPEMVLKPWLVIFTSFFITSLEHFWFTYGWPRYNLTILRLNLYLIRFLNTSLATALVVLFVNTFFSYQLTSNSFIIIQLIIAFVYSTSANYSFHQSLKNLLHTSYMKLNPYKAFHKLIILKLIQNNQEKNSQFVRAINHLYFHFVTTNVSINKIFDENNFSRDIDLNEKSVRNQIKRNFLEKIVAHFGSNCLLRLLLAKFYARNLNLFVLAIKCLSQIKSPSFTIRSSSDLLHLHIQDQVLKRSQDEDCNLKVYEYVSAKALQHKITQHMKYQLTIQKKFWTEYNQNKPDIWKLQHLSELIHQQKLEINKFWFRLEHNMKVNIYPFCQLYGHYQTILNNSLIEGEEYFQKYNLAKEKYEKILEHVSSITLPLYDDNNNFIVSLRTDQEHIGMIINSSNSIKKILGYEKNMIQGSNISFLMSPYIAAKHNEFLNLYIRTGVSSILDHFRTVFVKNQKGFLQKVSLMASIHPFVHKEVYLTGIFQIIKDPFEYIFVTPSGEIDSFTEHIGLKLGLMNRKSNIWEICPSFLKINKAYNLLAMKKVQGSISTSDGQKETARENHGGTNEYNLSSVGDSLHSQRVLLSSHRKSRNIAKPTLLQIHLEEKEDEEIYEKYSKKGKKLEFIHSTPEVVNKRFVYSCKVDIQAFKNGFLKVVEIHLDNMEADCMEVDLMGRSEDNLQRKSQLSESSSSDFQNVDENIAPLQEDPRNIDQLVNSQESARNRHNLLYKPNTTIITLKQGFYSKKISSNEFIETKTADKKFNLRNIVKKPDLANHSVRDYLNSENYKNKQHYIDQSLRSDNYPKSICTFILFLLLASVVILATQINLPVSTKQALHTIKDLTTTCDLANSGADAFSHVDLEIRASFAAESGFIASSSISSSIKETLYMDIIPTVLVLKEANYNLNIAIRNIDEVFRLNFISNNIRITDIHYNLTAGSSRQFEMFGAVNILIQKLLKLKQKYALKRKFELEELAYILINSSNDILERVVNTVSALLNDTQSSVANTLSKINTLQILCVILIIITLIVSLCFFYWLYKSELDLMQQFLTIKSERIQSVQSMFDKFQEYLESEEIHSGYQISNSYHMDQNQTNTFNQIKTNKVHKTLRTESLKIMYAKKVIIFFLILIVYAASVGFPFRKVYDNVAMVSKKIDRLAITQSTLYEQSIVTFALGQLASGDTVGLIRNRLPEEELQFVLQSILQKINNLFSAFKEADGTIDADTAPILLEDACRFLKPAAKSPCQSLTQGSKNTGLLSLIAKFHTLASQIYDDYKTSNKSLPELKRLSFNVFGPLGLQNYVLREILLIMVDKARDDFKETWEDVHHQAHIFIFINILLFLVSSLFIWKFALSSTINFLRRIKRMIKLIPVDVMLESPILKGLLRKISNKSTTDTIKNDF